MYEISYNLLLLQKIDTFPLVVTYSIIDINQDFVKLKFKQICTIFIILPKDIHCNI